jgi:hypothetical protein
MGAHPVSAKTTMIAARVLGQCIGSLRGALIG